MSIKFWLAKQRFKVNTAQRNRTTLNKIRQIFYFIALISLIWTYNIEVLKIIFTPNRFTIINPVLASSVKPSEEPKRPQGIENAGAVDEAESKSSKTTDDGAGKTAPATVEDMIRQAFPQDQEDMIAIARAESRFKADAVNFNTNGTKDCGIFQINEIHGYDCEWLKDPKNNIEAAKAVYAKQGKKAWVTYLYAKRNNLPI